MNKTVLAFGGAVVIVGIGVGLWYIWQSNANPMGSPAPVVANYQTSIAGRVVSRVADGLGAVTRVKLTPDEKLMFVTNLKGDVFVLENREGQYVRQADPIYKLSLGWEDGAENGLTGLIVSSEYIYNQTIFLLYAKKQPSGIGVNEIMSLVVHKDGDMYRGGNAKVIFAANTPIQGAHQIQGGANVKVERTPHLLFAIGDGYEAKNAEDVSREAGKIMLIQEDGSSPLGTRPFPQYPKIQALGIRNVYDLAIDPTTEWVYISENGPETNDRILYLPLMDTAKRFNLNWDGTPQSLATVVENNRLHPEYVIKLWDRTVAPTDIIADGIGRFYVNIFSTNHLPTKEILMGSFDDEKNLTLEPVISRREGAEGGNLLGLTLSQRGNFYFGDYLDGALYSLGRSWEATT